MTASWWMCENAPLLEASEVFIIRETSACLKRSLLPLWHRFVASRGTDWRERGIFFLIKGNKPGVSSITWSMQGCCKFKDLNSLQSGPGPHQLISLIYGFYRCLCGREEVGHLEDLHAALRFPKSKHLSSWPAHQQVRRQTGFHFHFLNRPKKRSPRLVFFLR